MSHTNEERDMLVADIVTRDWRDRWRKLAAAIEDGTLAQVLWEQIQSQIPDEYADRMDAAPEPPAAEAPELDWKSWSDVASILEDADASTELHPLRDAIEMGGPIIRALAEDRANECTAKHSAWESLGWAEKDRDEWRRRAEAAEAKLAAANERLAAVGEWIGRWPMSHGEVAGVLRSEASRREGLMQVRGETGNVLDRLRRTADAIAAGPPPRPDAGGEA